MNEFHFSSPFFCVCHFEKPKIYFNQWNCQKIGSVLLTITLLVDRNYYKICLAANGLDGNGLQLEKFANFFKFFLCIVQKSLKPDYSLFFL